MKAARHKYSTGEPVRCGDWVKYVNREGMVVFVADDRLYASGYLEKDWGYIEKGFMLEMENGAKILLDGVDEELVLLAKQNEPRA